MTCVGQRPVSSFALAASQAAPAGWLKPSIASTAFRPAMMPPLESVVRSPESGVEIRAQALSATRSSEPNGSRATTAEGSDCAHNARAHAGDTAAASAICAAHEVDCLMNSRRGVFTLMEHSPNRVPRRRLVRRGKFSPPDQHLRKTMAKKKSKKAAKPARKAVKAKKVVKKPAKQAVRKSAPKVKATAKAAPAHNPWKTYADAMAREMAITLKLMRAYPADQAAFQPHPRSGSAHQLFYTFGVEQGITLGAINGTLSMPPQFPPMPATLGDCISTFEKNATAVVNAARTAKAEHHARPVQFFGGPQTIVDVPAGFVADLMLADQIHHRGQLSVYTRMAGGKVPSIYGPSADEPW